MKKVQNKRVNVADLAQEIASLLADWRFMDWEELPVYWPGKTKRFSYGATSHVREYYEEVYWYDLNKWLGGIGPSIAYRFPEPEVLHSEAALKKSASSTCPSKVGWQIALFEAWPEICKACSPTPSTSDAIKWLKECDSSGCILKGKDPGRGFWWKPQRGEEKEVDFKTVENVLSKWRTEGRLPKS